VGIDLNSTAPKYNYIKFNSDFGEHTIYPIEGMSFVIKVLDDPVVSEALAAKQKYCFYKKSGFAEYQFGTIDNKGHVFWIPRQFMPAIGPGSAEEYCQKGLFKGINGDLLGNEYVNNIISLAEIEALHNSLKNASLSWLGDNSSKGLWTGNCNNDSCMALLRKSDGTFVEERVPIFELSRFAPLCGTISPFNVEPSSNECDELVTCTPLDAGAASSGPYNVCSLKSTEEINLSNLSVTNVRANDSISLSDNSISLWIEGNLIKAKFIGDKHPDYSDGSIEMKIVNNGVNGDQYGIINITDNVNQNIR
jgi:hypothetical protein